MFANESGLLRLSDESLQSLNVNVIVLDIPANSECFGTALHRIILREFVGYSVPVLNGFLQAFGGQGAVKLSSRSSASMSVVHELSNAGSPWESECVFNSVIV